VCCFSVSCRSLWDARNRCSQVRVGSAADPVAAQRAGLVGDLTRDYFEWAYPWSFVIMFVYYPLVLFVDARRNKQACAEFRKRNVWLEHVWAAWNLLLSVLSAIAVYYIDIAIVQTAYRSIVDGSPWFCYHQTYRYVLVPELMFWFAVSKYFELLDTVFLLVLTDKPIAFLHSFHHVCTLTYVVYAAMHQETMTGHANALFGGMNVLVHTFMYLYYALQVCVCGCLLVVVTLIASISLCLCVCVCMADLSVDIGGAAQSLAAIFTYDYNVAVGADVAW
jgi:hypothetical protein